MCCKYIQPFLTSTQWQRVCRRCSNAFACMKIVTSQHKFNWGVWLNTSCYLNEWRSNLLMHICVTRHEERKTIFKINYFYYFTQVCRCVSNSWLFGCREVSTNLQSTHKSWKRMDAYSVLQLLMHRCYSTRLSVSTVLAKCQLYCKTVSYINIIVRGNCIRTWNYILKHTA